MSTTTSPLRPPAPRRSPDRVAVVALAAGDRVDRLGHRLLVRAALGRRARRARPRPRAPSPSRPAASAARASARPSARASRAAAAPGASRTSRAAPQVRGLEVGQRVGPVGRGELACSRSSRMRADCSAITCRSWCCTAADDPSPNSAAAPSARRGRSPARRPRRPWSEELRDHRALSVNAVSTSRETFSNSLRTNSRVQRPPARAPARARRSRSRRRPRAPRPRPPRRARRTKSAAAGSSTTTFSTITRPMQDVDAGCGAERVAASIGHATVRTSADGEAARAPRAPRSAPRRRDTDAWPGPPRTNATIASTASAVALEHDLDRRRRRCCAPSPADAAAVGLAARRVAEEDALHAAVGDRLDAVRSHARLP